MLVEDEHYRGGVFRRGELVAIAREAIAGVAGIAYAATNGSVDPTAGSALILPAYAAVFLGATARHMKRQRSGSIITTASTAGLRNDPFTPYSYAIAKARPCRPRTDRLTRAAG